MTFEDPDSEVLRLLGEHAGVGLWDCVIAHGDPFSSDTMWRWSSEFRRMLGFASKQDFPDHVDALLERFHADELDSVLGVFNGAVAENTPVSHYDMKFRVRLADNTYRWFRSIGNVKHNPAGVATRACGSLIDIHDGELAAAELLRHSESELSVLASAHAASQNRFEQIADTSVDGIACTDENGFVTFWNKRLAEWLKIPAEAIIGRHLEMVLPHRFRGLGGFRERYLALIGDIHESECVDAKGVSIPVEVSVSTWIEDGRNCFGLIARDITARKVQEAMLVQMARRDILTGLPNRLAMSEKIETLLESDTSFSLMMIDLDGFKAVNDSYGHETGDIVLQRVAERLITTLPSPAFASRLGGDEFAVILPAFGTPESVHTLGISLIAAIEQPISIDGVRQVQVSATVGASFAGDGAPNAAELMRAADLALYSGKREGKGRVFLNAMPTARVSASAHTATRESTLLAGIWNFR